MSIDQRPSALYLLAHQGPLRNPRPIEVQHMRLRRYMDLLNELKDGNFHYDEAHDIYVDFNLGGTGQFPAFMRLGEAIGAHRYQAVFVDLVGPASFAGSSFRDIAASRIESALRQLPGRLIDVSRDLEGVLEQRLKDVFPRRAQIAAQDLQDGHDDLICFFPGLAAGVLRAVFHSERWERHEDVNRKIEFLAHENPYSGGREPWLPDSVADRYRKLEEEDRKRAEAERRAAGETLYRLSPDAEPVLVEHGFWHSKPRDAEGLAAAEKRLREFGFQKHTEGQVVWWERKVGERVLFADPRTPGKISIAVYQLGVPKGKRGKPKWEVVLRETGIPDHWWRNNPEKKFAEWLSKQGLDSVELHPYKES